MPIKKISLCICAFFLLLIPLFIAVPYASSDTLDDVNKQLAELNAELSKSVAATKPVESELKRMQDEIASIKNRVVFIDQDLAKKKKDIDKGYKDFAEKEKLIGRTVRDFYIKSYYDSPFLIFFSEGNASDITQALAYQRAKTNQNKAIITNIALSLVDLETKKENLKNEQEQLVKIKASLDEQSVKLDKVVAGAKDYQSKLSGKIAQLTAQQQALIAQKLSSLGIPRSAGTSARGCSSDLTNGRDPGFSPRFGFFTYGAPHRNGLNQYGAFGRARAGQNEEQILAAYYPNMTLKKDYDQGVQVNVDGYGTFSIEDYVKRIWEVPNSWGDENGMAALKAQAVAARTYALNSMQRNGHICTTEACQVFHPDAKGGNWDAAVEATKGWVMMDGGNPGFTQYASTHGGYILNLSKFDGEGTPTSFAELNARAYDKESPWFYCNWGSRSQYAGTAWLKASEVADIANAIMLVKRDSATADKLYQPDKPHPEGREVWSPDRVKQELQARGGTPVDNASDVSVSVDFGSGKTTNMSINGNSFDATEFKNWFNLRAPANIQIVGPLYNIEKQ